MRPAVVRSRFSRLGDKDRLVDGFHSQEAFLTRGQTCG